MITRHLHGDQWSLIPVQFFTCLCFSVLLQNAYCQDQSVLANPSPSPSVSPTQSPTQSSPQPRSLSPQVIAHFDTYQPTGIAVSKEGRIFVNFPLWSSQYKDAVVELMPDGSTQSYPNAFWNSWKTGDKNIKNKLICVQSIYIDDNNYLWILDPASPEIKGVIEDGAKLLKVDLKSNRVVQEISFNSTIAPEKSYLNDVRVDTKTQTAYISESGIGAIIVVDLKSGEAKRLLGNHYSVKPEKDLDIIINGKTLRDEENKPPQFACDGIALSPDGNYLYYQALTGTTLYRVPTKLLKSSKEDNLELDKSVEKVATLFPNDGYWMDKQGNLYLTSITDDSIIRRFPDGTLERVANTYQLQWPDSFAQGPDGSIYFTCSQIENMPKFNQGKDTRVDPYCIFKFTPTPNRTDDLKSE